MNVIDDMLPFDALFRGAVVNQQYFHFVLSKGNSPKARPAQ